MLDGLNPHFLKCKNTNILLNYQSIYSWHLFFLLYFFRIFGRKWRGVPLNHQKRVQVKKIWKLYVIKNIIYRITFMIIIKIKSLAMGLIRLFSLQIKVWKFVYRH